MIHAVTFQGLLGEIARVPAFSRFNSKTTQLSGAEGSGYTTGLELSSTESVVCGVIEQLQKLLLVHKRDFNRLV